MAPKRSSDGPGLVLRVTGRGVVPHQAIDQETLAGLRPGTILNASILTAPPSVPLRAWWALMGDVLRHEPQWITARALSNAILRKCDLTEEEALIGGGVYKAPMSLKDFTDEELWNLIELGKRVIETEIIPGVDVKALQKESNRGL